MSTVLDPLTLPLRGSALIEASAGTGKTYTIALLYLRWVLGHAAAGHEAMARMPPELLVVTFTEAATRELRGRIRDRLAEAAQCFLAPPEPLKPGDGDPLRRLRADYEPSLWPVLAQRLSQAAQWMDEAAISTIHSWAFRMLREHAFDSGSLFSLTLLTDASEALAECSRDYWRTFVYPLSERSAIPDAGEVYLDLFTDPDSLMKAVKARLAWPLDTATPEPGRLIEDAYRKLEADLQQARADLNVALPVFRSAWAQAIANKQLVKRLMKPPIENYLEALQRWCEGGDFPNKTTESATKLRREGADKIFLDPSLYPQLNAFWTAYEQAAGLTTKPSELPGQLINHAAAWIAKRFAGYKLRRAEMGFDDLLNALDEALAGAGGAALAQRIRNQYPVAMIDEFQDTDPVQYRIFDRIYRIADNDPQTALLMIGDPKQAIYSFRGADIFAYLAARRATRGRHYTLGTNYRSTGPMVAAVNHIFAAAEARPTGAFRFKDSEKDASERNDIPFNPVAAKGRQEMFQIEGHEVTPIRLWQLTAEVPPAKMTKKAYLSAMAIACAHEIVFLLNMAERGQAGFLSDNGTFKPVTSGDIAILVNNGEEADIIRRHLRQVGVKSVYLSDRSSVLDTPLARDVLILLRACAEPLRESGVRAALATLTLSVDYTRLDFLNQDELAWEAMVEQFQGYHQRWRDQGVLAMLYRLLHDFEVPARLLQKIGGERELTDLLHLAELLQMESQSLDGEFALVRALSERLKGDDAESDAMQVRLESDADLVQVVTVHKSKGLEYPLVFLPFASAVKEVTANQGRGGLKAAPRAVVWHDAKGVRVTYDATPDQVAQADEERLGEDIRKLYVALTRARHCLWLGVTALDDVSKSAIGCLLGMDDACSPQEGDERLSAALSLWTEAPSFQGQSLCALLSLPDSLPTPRPPAQGDTLHPVREPERRATENWWIASYSSLSIREGSAVTPLPESGRGHHWLEEGESDDGISRPTNAQPALSTERTMHSFYRGPGPGTFLHDLLEWMTQQGFAACVKEPHRVLAELERRASGRPGWLEWTPVLADWLQQVVSSPLPLPLGGNLELASLGHFQAELEFMLPSHRVSVQDLDHLITQYTLAGHRRPALGKQTMHGMLKGFIDLVFCSEGRYYVLDYKSNQLGMADADYTEAALRHAVLEKRYDVQYCLYLLALHRLLKSRLPGYDYDTHMGGAVYVFLRGISGPRRGVFAERPPATLIHALDRLFQGQTLEQLTHDST